jgi:ABC-2 type transport system ATP-binding protein
LISIEFNELVKKYKDVYAINGLTANIQSGRITGFLGPNGAGKSTTLRCLLGLAEITSGSALIEGKSFKDLEHPLRKVGAVLDSSGFNGALTASQNLRVICAEAALDATRIPELLKLVELDQVANKRTKGFSLGMRQRLSLAMALLGDPEILILDEPANGLDPVGIAWLREFLRNLANQGKTVLVSSHQLAEMQHTIDDVIIINHGNLITAGPLKDVLKNPAGGSQTLEEAFLRLIGVNK